MLAHRLVDPLRDTTIESLPTLLRLARTTICPNDTLPPTSTAPPADPVASTAKARRAAAVALLNALFPRTVALRLFCPEMAPSLLDMVVGEGGGSPAEKREQTRRENERLVAAVHEEVLCVFEDGYMNKGLVYAVLERVLGSIFPELRGGESGVGVEALLRERGVVG